MDQDRFDGLTRSLGAAASRRGLGRALAGGGLGTLVGSALGALTVDAKKKRHKKKKNKKQQTPQPVLNQFGCLDIGQPCRGDSTNCCSGICAGVAPKKGRPDTSTCVTHNAGICFADSDSCSAGVNVPCNPSNPSCFCALTTGDAGFCASFTGGPAGHCRVCTKDTDCQAEFGAGAACLVLGGVCTPLCSATGRTACAPPCA